ncbi:glycosyltransferase family 2 protein [Advenella alkanexedens]|uniref:Glycosyltransferase family 2 protein n=1 Tax=Advenella alkanexedens TaxID=1481665 RepID=A0ABS6NKF3_9BURK|nr:glycosyltransferase family A protein [Advenella alkanexedens]MBV4396110.1 glycosyltransferase family 2 protein [Advenella alkanexedens]
MITILTPTYNRKHTLPELYKSLINQTSYDFEWLIIDDGSIDNTESLIKNYQKSTPFNIQYIKKPNGGKCSALNIGIKSASYDWIFIMDSDDTVIFDAIEKINKLILNDIDESIGSIFCLAKIENKKNKFFDIVGKSRFCDWVKTGNLFDTAPLIRKSIAINYPFPLYENEKYMAESWLSLQIDRTHFSYFLNQFIMNAEYQPDGLSTQSLKLRCEAPINAMKVYGDFLSSNIGLNMKSRYAINYWRFYFHAKLKYKKIKTNNKFIKYLLFYPFGYIFFIIDNKKNIIN